MSLNYFHEYRPVRTWADHAPCQPTIAAQLLLDGGKIEPYTIIIMVSVHLQCFVKFHEALHIVGQGHAPMTIFCFIITYVV
jgi:hypothetical protein